MAVWVAAKLTAEPTQVVPFQKLLSLLRCKVKVVLSALRPLPLELSAALPEKLAGTSAALKVLALTGVVSEAVIGLVLSSVKVTAVPVTVLPALSVAVAVIVNV